MKKSIIVLAILLAALIVSCASTGGSAAAGGGGGGSSAAPTTKIELAAKDAKLSGDVKYEIGDNRDNVGWWIDQDATASWTFDVKDAGEYDAVVSIGMDSGFAGSTFTLTVAGQTLKFTAQSTGDWGKWKEFNIGKVKLPAGSNTVVVKCTNIANKYAINLHAVIFQK